MPASVSSSVPPRASTVPLFATRRVSTGNLSFPIFQPTVISANTYDIILLLDNREIGRYGNRDALRDGLEKLKVPVEQRALAVGDTVWIARSRENERECVLNWIVERKRLDDLCASIKDSRFQDQKHRLYQSGLTHVFYLVEHFAVQRLMSSHRLMINTALSRTQVVDEFQVKETSSQQETIEFLANMHLAIQTILTGQSLYVLPSSALSRPTYMAFQAHLRESEPDIEYLPSWSDFQNLNGKNATRTVGETWARMQLCIKGLSAERVSKLLEHYRTPRELWEAYCEAENIEALAAQSAGDVTPGKGKGKKKASGPKTMLSELGGEGRRKITDAMSQKVQEILMSRTYL
ncbi:restriction endonuclease-like protein [Calocera viscosa TUFC12733]|uniref:Crossover junction endonuclease MUS81 n=1 Tax=Calocera viscosa (strain TUFC12733) TaxID=1330018 RepID=A0A167HTH2_CALVF|nr:restriction endonuclease-like protein [Calocera viscosa TUFC12733]